VLLSDCGSNRNMKHLYFHYVPAADAFRTAASLINLRVGMQCKSEWAVGPAPFSAAGGGTVAMKAQPYLVIEAR